VINLEEISSGLRKVRDGYWVSNTQTAVSYPEWGNEICYQLEENSFWFDHRNNCILELIERFPPVGALFDVGGGNGFVAKFLLDAGYPVVLVEPGMEGVRNALARGVSPVVCATIEEAGFKESSLPAVGMFDMLEHIERDMAFLELLNRLMIPGGRLYLTVPSFRFLWSQDDVVAGHFRRYTLGALQRKLTLAGFRVEFQTYLFAFLPLPIFLFRTIPSVLGLRKSERIDPAGYHSQHVHPSGIGGKVLNWFLNREQTAVNGKTRIPLGASCLVVARVSK